MTEPILLCSDLDRTLLPNGRAPESPHARPLLRAVAARPELHLVYVSGRHLALLETAIREYQLPRPDYAIGDVGTTIHTPDGDGWRLWEAWSEAIAPDWRGYDGEALARILEGVGPLRLQEPEKQNRFKLSYYAPADCDRGELFGAIQERLTAREVRANLIWSIDDLTGEGLLDILPASASKLHAIRFLMERRGYVPERTLFAGDSGNDLPVLTSGLPAVLVRNATDTVRAEARARAREPRALYSARGDFLGMNGNYSAGVLEGLAHHLPEMRPVLARLMERVAADG